MENKEIYIDGVDVTGCGADKKKMKNGLYCFWEGGNCEYNKYCYYKECKRLEQENKQMKSALEEINITVKQLLKGVSSNCINNTPYLTALSLIQDKINEVIK